MQGKKAAAIIDTVKEMTDRDAGMLEAFISGLQAGKQLSDRNDTDVFAPHRHPVGTIHRHPSDTVRKNREEN